MKTVVLIGLVITILILLQGRGVEVSELQPPAKQDDSQVLTWEELLAQERGQFAHLEQQQAVDSKIIADGYTEPTATARERFEYQRQYLLHSFVALQREISAYLD